MSTHHYIASSPRNVVALVTGCSKGGIGHSLSQELASKGCIVYATARRLDALDGFDSAIIRKLALDVTNDDNVQEVVRTIIEKEGQIDILVNNAGISQSGPLADVSMDEFIAVYDTNVFSVIRMSKAVIPHMAARKKGTIVNIGSIGGEIPIPWGGPYCSSKAAVHSLTDVLYMECTPLNIDVVLVSPGGVRSNIATNQAPRVQLPPDSLYAGYVDAILKKLNSSQSNNPMSSEQFAQRVVGAVLQPRPPRYLTLATSATIFSILKWLPRGWVLRRFWNWLGEGPRLAAKKRSA